MNFSKESKNIVEKTTNCMIPAMLHSEKVKTMELVKKIKSLEEGGINRPNTDFWGNETI